MVKPSTNSQLESPTLRLLRIIGSPLIPAGQGLLADSDESIGLYQLAIKNKIPLLYLEALKKQGKLNLLNAKYDEEKVKYQNFTDAMVRLSRILNAAGIKYVIFKTIKPYPAVPVDIDLLILDNDDMYKRTVEALLRAGYPPQTPNIVNMADLTDDKAYQRATELLTRPTYGKRHVSPTGTDFLDPEYGIDIDLQKDIALSYIVYLDKNKFNDNIIKARLNEQEVNTLAGEFDLMSVIAHSLMEQLYLLGEYYACLYYLSAMDEREISHFVDVAGENRFKAAMKAFTAVTAELHQAAHGTIPEKLEFILSKLGSDASEARNLMRHNFKTPHRYSLLRIAKIFWEKLGERNFRRSLAKQVIKTLNPSLGRLVVRELVDRLKRETYLEEVEVRNQR